MIKEIILGLFSNQDPWWDFVFYEAHLVIEQVVTISSCALCSITLGSGDTRWTSIVPALQKLDSSVGVGLWNYLGILLLCKLPICLFMLVCIWGFLYFQWVIIVTVIISYSNFANGSPFGLASFSFLMCRLFWGLTRCSRLILYILCTGTGVSYFSRVFLSVDNGISKPRCGQ